MFVQLRLDGFYLTIALWNMHTCVHIYTYTQRTDKQTNKNFDAMEIYPNETYARRQSTKREGEREQSNQANKLLYSASLSPLTVCVCVHLQSHAVCPHLIVDATIRVVNNVTVSIPQWSLTLGTEAQCKTNQFLINNNSYYMDWKQGVGRGVAEYLFL